MKKCLKVIIFCTILLLVFLQSIPISNAEEKSESIENGATYIIKSMANENFVLDVAGNSSSNGGNIQLWTNANVPQQKFIVKSAKEGVYSFTVLSSGKMLDVSGGSMAEGANVQQWESNETNSQKWEIKSLGNGQYSIISKLNGKYLTVSGTAKNGANIQINNSTGSANQKFIFQKVAVLTGSKTISNGTYAIKTKLNENYVFDIGGGSTANGANLQLWNNALVEQQRYNIKYLSNGYYSISSAKSNKMIDVSGGSMAEGTNVQQWESNGTDSQKWIIKSSGDGYYYIISKLSEKYLTVKGSTAKNEANIQVNDYSSSTANAQKFKIEEQIVSTETIKSGTYTIESNINGNYIFDVGGASLNDGGNVQLWKNSDARQQKYKIAFNKNDGYYEISSVNSNKMLDVSGGSTADGANVQQWASNGTDSQKWIIIKNNVNGKESYSILSKLNYKAVTVSGGKAANGANIQMNAYENALSQQFTFKETTAVIGEKVSSLSNDTYKIKTALNENYVLDIGGGSVSNGANLQIWGDTSVSQQKYKIKYIENGYYSISSVKSNKMLDVSGGSTAEGANVQQWESNGTDSQKWIIKDLGNGYYNIVSKLDDKYLTVANGKATNGANIQLNNYKNDISQKFKIEIASNIEINESQYPGYKQKIEKLMEEHPNWNFELLYTGLTFNQVVSGEYSVRARNLVPTSYGGEWISGTSLYDTGWYAASEKAIAYYMDPRNFLDTVSVFQFLDVNDYSYGSCSIDGINKKVTNTYLANYSADVNNACINQNVNAYYIIARLLQEQGSKGGATVKMSGGDGKYYYNPFNIGASGNSTSEVIANALAKAKSNGWDTMQKAIEGGITFCKKNWLDNYQNTLYQNKFDIDTRNGTSLYAHQYMQNLMAASSEANTLYSMYNNTGKVDSNFTFIIPIYEEMDSTISPIPKNTTETYPMNVVTTGTNVIIREDASTDSDKIATIPNKGTRLLSVQRGINSNWQRVVTDDGIIGYMYGNYLQQVDDYKTCSYTAKVWTSSGGGCYLRAGPSTSLPSVSLLPYGTSLTVIDNKTYYNINEYHWVRAILSNGTQGFIPAEYLK